MKKAFFVFLAVLGAVIGALFTFGSVLQDKFEGTLLEVCLLSYPGVILPAVVLELAKLVSFKNQRGKVQAFDIVGVAATFAVLVVLNSFYGIEDIGGETWRREFCLWQIPWVISLLMQSLLLAIKAKRQRSEKTVKE